MLVSSDYFPKTLIFEWQNYYLISGMFLVFRSMHRKWEKRRAGRSFKNARGLWKIIVCASWICRKCRWGFNKSVASANY
jgi:hypothetical protein